MPRRPPQELLRRLPWCTCVSASASQSRAQCRAREFCCKILVGSQPAGAYKLCEARRPAQPRRRPMSRILRKPRQPAARTASAACPARPAAKAPRQARPAAKAPRHASAPVTDLDRLRGSQAGPPEALLRRVARLERSCSRASLHSGKRDSPRAGALVWPSCQWDGGNKQYKTPVAAVVERLRHVHDHALPGRALARECCEVGLGRRQPGQSMRPPPRLCCVPLSPGRSSPWRLCPPWTLSSNPVSHTHSPSHAPPSPSCSLLTSATLLPGA